MEKGERSAKQANGLEYTLRKENIELPPGPLPPQKRNFKCTQCGYVTERKNNLKRHSITMHQDCPRILECCDVVFKSKSLLREHVSLFHQTGYSCQICGRMFCRRALVRRHMTVHNGKKDFRCTMCNYATSHKNNLERHQKVHKRNELKHNWQDHINQISVEGNNPKCMKFRDLRASLYESRCALNHRSPGKHYLFSDRLKETYNIPKLSGWSLKRSRWSPASIAADSALCHKSHTENKNTIVCNHMINNLSEKQYDDPDIIPATMFSDDTTHHGAVAHDKMKDRKGRFQCNRIFAQPYKCPVCENVFSSQFLMLSHSCKKTQNSNVSYSLITVTQNNTKTRQDQKHFNARETGKTITTTRHSFTKTSSTAIENGYEHKIPTYMLPLKKRIVENSTNCDKQ